MADLPARCLRRTILSGPVGPPFDRPVHTPRPQADSGRAGLGWAGLGWAGWAGLSKLSMSIDADRARRYLVPYVLTFFSIAAVALGITYAALQGWFLYGWSRVPVPQRRDPRRRWSIVIAARNEAQQLDDHSWHGLLSSLSHDWQSFALRHSDSGSPSSPYEVILVDDHSTDGTAEVARRFPHVRVLVLPEGHAGKKAALAYGISQASGDWIATLDADVHLRQDWLRHLDDATTGQVAVAGPVALTPYPENSWFQRWQALDFAGMMVITGASLWHGRFVMGNGANLAFAKTAYEAVGGYESPDGSTSASGDDMVLLGKLTARFAGRVTFAKDPYCIVYTSAKPTLRGFVQQRWRWSAKTGLNHQPALTVTLAFTWVFHVGLLLGIPMAAAGLLPWPTLLVAWSLKLVVDFVLLREAGRMFGAGRYLDGTYPVQSVLHTLYVAGIGTLALLPLDYEWKGRRHRV